MQSLGLFCMVPKECAWERRFHAHSFGNVQEIHAHSSGGVQEIRAHSFGSMQEIHTHSFGSSQKPFICHLSMNSHPSESLNAVKRKFRTQPLMFWFTLPRMREPLIFLHLVS